MSELKRIVEEIHRRSLWQVLGIYLAGSWVALQVVEQLAEAAGLPEWVRPFALVLLILGVPIVLATAFVQEGMGTRDASDAAPGDEAAARQVDTTASSPARLLTWRNALVGGGLAAVAWGIVATGLLIAGRDATDSAASTTSDDQPAIVAVLPLENMSADASNAFFADGVHEEILNSLSQIDDLRVISRTSVLRYEDSPLTLPEIGRELGATAVLEGSVRRAEQQVRVAAQLVDVATDQNLWSRTFDGDLSDIFAIQSDIAREIANALAAELTQEDQEALSGRPTQNLAAYDAYLEGLSHDRRRLVREDAERAAAAFRRATELDPNFGEAWAALATAEISLEWFHNLPDAGLAAIAALERAQQLLPGAVETLVAAGNLHYYGERDYEAALESYFAAQRIAPNRADVIEAIGFIRRRQGRWDDALANFRRATELDPYSDLPFTTAQSYFVLRRYDEAERQLAMAVAAAPNLAGRADELRFMIRLAERDLEGARRVAAATEDAATADRLSAWLALIERDFDRVLELNPVRAELVTSIPTFFEPGFAAAVLSAEDRRRDVAERLRGLVDGNRDTLPYFRYSVERSEALAVRDDALRGLADALTGSFAAAREQLVGQRRMWDFSRDAMIGWRMAYAEAVVEIAAGDRARAIANIEEVLRHPSYVSVGFLELNPLFDSLREEPDFQRLLDEYR